MSLFVILAVIAIILLFVGGFVQTLQWLLWIGIILLAVAVIMWLVRLVTGRRSSV